MKRRNLIEQMRASAGEAELLLRAYDRVLADLRDSLPSLDRDEIAYHVLGTRRARLASDLRRLREEVAAIEAKDSLR